MLKEVRIPEISENVTSGKVVDVLVKPGDHVEVGDPIIEFETDVLGKLTIRENDPGPRTTAYGLLADFINAVRHR